MGELHETGRHLNCLTTTPPALCGLLRCFFPLPPHTLRPPHYHSFSQVPMSTCETARISRRVFWQAHLQSKQMESVIPTQLSFSVQTRSGKWWNQLIFWAHWRAGSDMMSGCLVFVCFVLFWKTIVSTGKLWNSTVEPLSCNLGIACEWWSPTVSSRRFTITWRLGEHKKMQTTTPYQNKRPDFEIHTDEETKDTRCCVDPLLMPHQMTIRITPIVR